LIDAPGPTVWLLSADAPTLVLGSAQPAPAGPTSFGPSSFVRRRSGGGAVWLDPTAVLWVDIFVTAADALWEPDVGRAFWWVGDLWATAIDEFGPRVHRSALVRTRWSDRVCFAGLGPGEVTVGGRKVVGISQRRWRAGCLFQCAALLRWDYEETARRLDVPAGDLEEAAAGVGAGRDALLDAFLDALRHF